MEATVDYDTWKTSGAPEDSALECADCGSGATRVLDSRPLCEDCFESYNPELD